MLLEKDLYFNMDEVIRNEKIVTFFQPIISVKKKTLIGLEALSRGIHNGHLIPPETLFRTASIQGLTLELDRLCRKKALEAFAEINRNYGQYILFINFDSSIIDQGVIGSGNILDTVRNLGLDPSSIVIEINEANTDNVKGLENFINTYKSYGFMIALDDVGAGYSSLNRLAIVKPDILKIDKMLIRAIDIEFYKQEVVRSLVSLSRKIGALVIAEGIETGAEAITTLNMGVDMLQGYYFSKPCRFDEIDFEDIRRKKQLVASEYKTFALQKAYKEKGLRKFFESTVKCISKEICKTEKDSLNIKLSEIVLSYENIECAYVLDIYGIQYSDTIFNKNNDSSRRKAIFSPAVRGADHTLKDYYYLNTGSEGETYVTEPYISLATGNLCVTISIKSKDNNDESFILCIDAIVE